MNLDFDYKIFDLENYLTKDEFVKLNTSLINFDVNVDEINSSLGFLQWSNDVENKVKEIDPIRYNKIVESYSLNYMDYCFLNKLNDQYGFNENDYFNFLLTHNCGLLKNNGIYDLIFKCYENILFELFNKKIKTNFKDSLVGHINVYPEGSFIKKHFDSDPNGERLFTAVFFINNDRKFDDGSLLKLYTKNGEIEVLPNFNKCVLIEHQKYNYIHEVTKNLSKDIRYSVYCPFTIKDYKEKLEDV
jgi:hypothetical protein